MRSQSMGPIGVPCSLAWEEGSRAAISRLHQNIKEEEEQKGIY